MQKAGKICPLFYSRCKNSLARRERAGERGQIVTISPPKKQYLPPKSNIPQKNPNSPKNQPSPALRAPSPIGEG